LFSTLHATEQAWQPVQRSTSNAIFHFGLAVGMVTPMIFCCCVFITAVFAQGRDWGDSFFRARTIRDKHGAPFCFFEEGDEQPQSTYV
jgi:hypothetical protein